MVTGELKSKIDRIWDAFWSGGISNPLEVIEQITYLLFIRRLDDLETLAEKRARWRLTRHAGPDADGATRWRCPFCSGLLRSRSFPKTMRHSRNAPLVETEAECCCQGILTAMPEDLPWRQNLTFGTTAWRVSMGRRQVESANSALKGAFVNLGRGFMRVFGTLKTTMLLAFTIAAFNLDRVRSYRAKHGLDENAQVVDKPKEQRARRRTGTWADTIEAPAQPPPEAP